MDLNIQIYNRFFHYSETLGDNATEGISAKEPRVMAKSKFVGQRKPNQQCEAGEVYRKRPEKVSQLRNGQPHPSILNDEGEHAGYGAQ